jgi:ribosomal protein S18 acetylase RimI-like enzyme
MGIFNMSDSDIKEVRQIEKDCQVGSWSSLDYKNEIERKDGLAFVVKEQSQVVGFIVARLIMKVISTNSTNNLTSTIETSLREKNSPNLEAEIEIYNIAVKLNFQNQGVGQKLINQIVSRTANLQSRSIWLEVRESNTKAIKFYEKNGFTKISKRKNFYGNPLEDGIVMNKLLTSF